VQAALPRAPTVTCGATFGQINVISGATCHDD
jgi:hypothetical protein